MSYGQIRFVGERQDAGALNSLPVNSINKRVVEEILLGEHEKHCPWEKSEVRNLYFE